MRKIHKLYFYLFFTLTTVSGLGLWVVEEFFKQQTPYGLMPSAWQAYWLDFHLITLPFTMISLGGLTLTHVIPQLKVCADFWKRYTGILLTALLGMSVLSGYGVQIHFLESIPLSSTHEWSSLASLIILMIHIYACRLSVAL